MAGRVGRLNLLLLFGMLLVLFALAFVVDLGLEGADDMAGEAIGEIAPHYQPWFSSLWEPGELAERAIFALQGLGGLALAVYFFLKLRAAKADARR